MKKAEQLKAKKRRVRFLMLMILSGGAAIFLLNLPNVPSSGSPSYVLLACSCAALVLTFVISGVGLIANLFQWMNNNRV